MHKIVIIGAGNWGTTLGVLLAQNHKDCTLLFRSAKHLQSCLENGRNQDYLPEVDLPPNLHLSDEPGVLQQAEIVVFAIPANAIRPFLEDHKESIRPTTPLLSLAKGIELSTGKMPSQILEEVLTPNHQVAALSGPNIASEIARGKPATAVIASDSVNLTKTLQREIACPSFRIYTNRDLVGVELCGALKNIIAIGAGVCHELELGDNALAALITRGIAEIARYGIRFGANPMTFMGVAGVGDLTVTCMSRHSRNNRLGRMLAQGVDLQDAQSRMRMVTEGVSTCKTVTKTATEHQIYMPISNAVGQLLFEGMSVREAIENLMQNSLREEMDLIS